MIEHNSAPMEPYEEEVLRRVLVIGTILDRFSDQVHGWASDTIHDALLRTMYENLIFEILLADLSVEEKARFRPVPHG